MKRYDFLKRFFALNDGRFVRIYEIARNLLSLKSQYLYFKRRFREDVLLFQGGNYYEFYHENLDGETARMLRLKRISKSSIRKVIYGFPVRLEKLYIDRLKGYGKSVAVIGEEDKYLTRVKMRLPKYRLVLC
jgi:DNA mismatch repair ATPase MutS